MSESLEIASQSLAALLATWLGLTVVSRAPDQRGPRVFGWVAFLVVAWSVAVIVERTTDDPSASLIASAIGHAAAYLLPASVLHVVLAFTVEGPYAAWQRAVLVVAYAVAAGMAIRQLADPAHVVGFEGPRLEPGFVSGDVVAWAWFAFRVAILGLAIGLTTGAFLGSGTDRTRRGQTMAALITVGLAAVGGTLTFLPSDLSGPDWIGVAIITSALVVATYAVLGQGVFLSRSAVANAFRSSLLGGVAVAAYVMLLVALESMVESVLSIELPLVLALGLVATVALFDPVRDRLRSMVDRWREPDRHAAIRLDRVLGAGMAQAPQSSIQPAIERLGRFLGFERALVVTSPGTTVASLGPGLDDALDVVKPLRSGGRTVGEARFGSRPDGRPYTAREDALLDDASDYIAASLIVGERHAQQVQAIQALAVEHQTLAERGSELQASLTEADEVERLTVYALGPMRVERAGHSISSWGGPKAGSRQAEAIFAFLFDRGDRGATKDEVLDVVWPDADVVHGDLAFHRTLSGLRGLLQPGRPRRGASGVIGFHHDRYRLSPSLVAWSDVAEFNELVRSAEIVDDRAEAIRLLTEARALYRGEFLDDCPLYGQSEYVEETRGELRGRLVDVLVGLGERHEERGDSIAAASVYRDALTTAGGECRRATEGLERLGLSA